MKKMSPGAVIVILIGIVIVGTALWVTTQQQTQPSGVVPPVSTLPATPGHPDVAAAANAGATTAE